MAAVGLGGEIVLEEHVTIARLAHPESFGVSSNAFATNESCALGTRVNVSPRDKVLIRSSATYAQDPFAIAGLGLLLRPGQAQILVGKFYGEWDHSLSAHSQMEYGLDTQVLTFGAGDRGNGYVLAPSVRYAWNTGARSKWDLGVREQLFFGIGADPNPLAPQGAPGGLLDEAHAALLGYTWAVAPWANLTVRGGPVVLTGRADPVAAPTLKVIFESYTPSTAWAVTVGHDLVIGPTSAGPLIGDIAELGVIQDWEHLGAHFRFGLYRNADAFQPLTVGAIGYGTEVGLAWKFTRDLRLEVAAMRDARVNDVTVAQQVDRDVVQLRLTWEKARF